MPKIIDTDDERYRWTKTTTKTDADHPTPTSPYDLLDELDRLYRMEMVVNAFLGAMRATEFTNPKPADIAWARKMAERA